MTDEQQPTRRRRRVMPNGDPQEPRVRTRSGRRQLRGAEVQPPHDPLFNPRESSDISGAMPVAPSEQLRFLANIEIEEGDAEDFSTVMTPQREYILRMVNKLATRGYSNTDIARYLNVRVATVRKWREWIKKRLKHEVQIMDRTSLVGQSILVYDEIRQEQMRIAHQDGATRKEKIVALDGARKAEDSKHSYLARIGFYDKLVIERPSEDQQSKDREDLLSMAKQIMSSDDIDSVFNNEDDIDIVDSYAQEADEDDKE